MIRAILCGYFVNSVAVVRGVESLVVLNSSAETTATTTNTNTNNTQRQQRFSHEKQNKTKNRRLLKDKIIALKKELAGVRRHRDFQRRSRKKLGLPVVALVGYTNAGKSTLLNTLTRAGVMAENMLFATLDPTTRKVKLSGLKVC